MSKAIASVADDGEWFAIGLGMCALVAVMAAYACIG